MSSIIRGDDNLDSADVESGRAKAWVFFDGDPASIIKAFNISSAIDTAVGIYSLTFTEAFIDTNYTVFGCGDGTANGTAGIVAADVRTSSDVVVRSRAPSDGILTDGNDLSVAVFR